jgi:predicted metalloendopeptidase
MDRGVLPGDDFLGFANGGWAMRTEIPPDRADWGIGAELTEATHLRLNSLLENAGQGAAAGSEPRKVADFSATFLDEASIEAKGVAPLQLSARRRTTPGSLRSEAAGSSARRLTGEQRFSSPTLRAGAASSVSPHCASS